MGYFFVILTVLSSVTNGYCGKRTSAYTQTPRSAMGFSALRMLLCVPIGAIFLLTGGSGFAVSRDILLVSFVSGLATAVFVVTWLMAVRVGAYMMVDAFLTLGVIIPVIASFFLWGEAVRIHQAIGIVMLIAAAFMMCAYSSKIKGKMTPAALGLLLLCGGSYGVTSLAQKWFNKLAGDSADASLFNFYTYVFTALLLALCYGFTAAKDRSARTDSAKSRPPYLRLGIYLAVMAFCLFANSLCSTLAARYLVSGQQYPLIQGSTMILSMIMTAAFFKEKITPVCMAGMGVIFAALLCINLF